MLSPSSSALPGPVQRWVVRGFFTLLLLLGVLLHRDYGVSWDEPTDHLNGLVNVKYIAGLVAPERVRQQPTTRLIPELAGYRDNDHGVVFEVPMSVLSYLFVHQNPPAYYFLRHFLLFVLFIVGVWSVYRIGLRWLGDWRYALLASLWLVLTPRLFAEAFYNGKDMLFLALFALGMSTLMRLQAHPTAGRAAWHGVATALAIDARIMGLLLVAYTAGLFTLLLLEQPAKRGHLVRVFGLYLLVAVAATLVGWPYLWADPPGHFAEAFRRLSHYPWRFTNLYLGHFYKAHEVPWHYVPVWLLVTTPVCYVVLAAVGLGASFREALRRPLLAAVGRHRLGLPVVAWLLGPVCLVILLQSSLYESWRHLYFVYPALVLLAARGTQVLLSVRRTRPGVWRATAAGVLVLGALETAYTVVRMVRLHPFQFAYFSFLPGPVAERLFERDYWGLSVRQGLEWLVRYQPTGPLRVHVRWPMHNPLYNNSLLLPEQQRRRIQYVPYDSADYFLTTYRWHPQSFRDSVGTEIHTIHAEQIRILSVFRTPRR